MQRAVSFGVRRNSRPVARQLPRGCFAPLLAVVFLSHQLVNAVPGVELAGAVVPRPTRCGVRRAKPRERGAKDAGDRLTVDENKAARRQGLAPHQQSRPPRMPGQPAARTPCTAASSSFGSTGFRTMGQPVAIALS